MRILHLLWILAAKVRFGGTNKVGLPNTCQWNCHRLAMFHLWVSSFTVENNSSTQHRPKAFELSQDTQFGYTRNNTFSLICLLYRYTIFQWRRGVSLGDFFEHGSSLYFSYTTELLIYFTEGPLFPCVLIPCWACRGSHWHTKRCYSVPSGYESIWNDNPLIQLALLMFFCDTKGKYILAYIGATTDQLLNKVFLLI